MINWLGWIIYCASLAVLARALAWVVMRSWGRPERFDAAWTWTRPAPCREAYPIGPRRPPAAIRNHRVRVVEHPSLTSGADVADALRPGEGSLVDLRRAPSAMRTSAEIAAELRAWIDGGTAVALDQALGTALSTFRAAVEPSMRKARLWELQGQDGHGGGASARVDLDRWRINTPTGEYALVASA